MRIIALLVILAGWGIAVGGLLVTQGTFARGILACVGIAVTLFGILGILNGYHLKNAIWKQ